MAKANIKEIEIADQTVCVYKGVVYLTGAGGKSDFEEAIKAGTLADYQQAKVADIKKVVGIIAGVQKAIKEVSKAKEKLDGFTLFGEMVDLDEDEDISVGCTYVNPDDAIAFAKKL